MPRKRKQVVLDQCVIDREKNMSNEELLDAVLVLHEGDDYDGCLTDEGALELNYLEGKLRERLKDWLSQKIEFHIGTPIQE